MAEHATSGVFFSAPSDDGDAARLIRERDWAATPIGPRDAWPPSLQRYVSMILELPTAAIIFWGPDHVQLYNDGYAVIMGPRHPEYLGAPFRECWPEAYDTIEPWMQRVLQRGETVEVKRTLVPLTRYGFMEESYFTFTFSPLRNDAGQISGILQLVTEVTAAVLAERRATVLHELSKQIALARTPQDATRLAIDVLRTCADDLPFVVLYLVDPSDPQRFEVADATGLAEAHAPFPPRVEVPDAGGALAAELARAVCDRAPVELAVELAVAGVLATRAVAVPLAAADQQSVVAILVVGASPRLVFDVPYRGFVQLVRSEERRVGKEC